MGSLPAPMGPTWGADMRRALLFLAFLAFVVGMVFMTCGVASAATCEINGGAKYTNNPVVRVHYDAGFMEEVSTRWKGSLGDDLGSARRRLLLHQIGRRNVEGDGHG
jgi:hypothetical protein